MKKLNKIIFEYDDGSIQILEGDICEEWLEDIDGVLAEMQIVRGRNFPALKKAKWKKYTAKEIRKLKLKNIEEHEKKI